MTKSKSLASLTPTLLARKGSAKPAMRPQLHPIHEATARQLDEDLGFNDMGLDDMGLDEVADAPATASHSGEVVKLKPAVAAKGAARGEVRSLQQQIASRIGKDARSGKQRRSALVEGRSAAFTLRLDADRHFELRLASALAGRSAQQLLTEALDHMIAELPEVADLAARAGKRN